MRGAAAATAFVIALAAGLLSGSLAFPQTSQSPLDRFTARLLQNRYPLSVDYVAEFAEARGVQSLHIVVLPLKGSQPFYPRVGQPAQVQPFSVEQDPRWLSVRLMVTNSLPQGWTLFDLRPLRRDFNALLRAANQDLAEIVFGIDMLVVVPEATPSTDVR